MDSGPLASSSNSYYKASYDFHGLDEELYRTVGVGLGSGLGKHSLLEQFTESLSLDSSNPWKDALSSSSHGATDEDEEDGLESEFVWDRCLPHQMFVFGGCLGVGGGSGISSSFIPADSLSP